jgi:ribose transport system substrate-binding protein
MFSAYAPKPISRFWSRVGRANGKQEERRVHDRRWFAALLVLCLALALGLTACGGGGSSSSSSTAASEESTGSEEEVAATEEGEAGAEEGGLAAAEEAVTEAENGASEISSAALGPFTPKPSANLFYISCDQAIEGCVTGGNGVRAAAKALGYHLEHCYEQLSDPESGEKCWAQAISAKPDVVLAQGTSMATAGKGFANAEAAGIPIISMFASEPPGPGRYELAGKSSCVKMGEILGNFVVADSGGEAHALAAYVTSFPCVPARLEGFEKAIEQCSGCSTKPMQFSAAAIQTQFPQQLQAELQGDPELNYLAGLYSEPALVGAQQVQQLGLKVKTVGFDASAPNMEALRHNEQYVGDISYGQEESGWVAVDAAARLLAGQEVPEEFEPTIVLITKKNVGEFEERFNGPPNFEKEFEELWE